MFDEQYLSKPVSSNYKANNNNYKIPLNIPEEFSDPYAINKNKSKKKK